MKQRIKMNTAAVLGGITIPEGATVELDAENRSLHYQGRRLELGLTVSDVHDPTEMPTYLAGYKNEEFRWTEACPVVLVDKDQDKFRTFDSANAFTPVRVKTDDNANIPELVVTSSLTPYVVQPRRIGSFIPDTVATQVSNPNLNPKFIHLDACARVIDMDLEIDTLGASGLLTTKAHWGTSQSTTLAANFQWNGGNSSNPPLDLQVRALASAQRITDWFMNQRVCVDFLNNPATRDYTRFKMGDATLDKMIRAVFDTGDGSSDGTLDFKLDGLGTFHVCCARATQSDGTLDFIMPDCVIGIHNLPGAPTSFEKVATAKNFRRRGPFGNGFNTREMRIETRGAGGTFVVAEEASIPTMTGTILGGYIDGVHQ